MIWPLLSRGVSPSLHLGRLMAAIGRSGVVLVWVLCLLRPSFCLLEYSRRQGFRVYLSAWGQQQRDTWYFLTFWAISEKSLDTNSEPNCTAGSRHAHLHFQEAMCWAHQCCSRALQEFSTRKQWNRTKRLFISQHFEAVWSAAIENWNSL